MRTDRGARGIFGGTERRQQGAALAATATENHRLSLYNHLNTQYFLQRFLLIAAFLAVDHDPGALWIALVAVGVNLGWAHRFEGLSLTAGRKPKARGKVVRSPATVPAHGLERTRDVIRATDAAEAHLVSLGDKDVLWSADGQAFLMYARQGSRLIALFDPVGPVECWPELMDGFMALARSQRCKPVFYQVSGRFMEQGAGRRLRCYKLGERADIRVDQFSMNGKEWASLRRALNRAERDGLVYSYLEAGGAAPIMDELRQVSDAWLGMNKTGEKRFSLGAFDPDYVNAFPLAVIRLEGRIIAFVNILTAGDSAFVDLMRFIPGVHRGAMDLLVVRAIESLREKGFSRLNLGMAPLSGLGGNPKASLWERLCAFVYERGNRYYNFKGLRAFKEKFDPEWDARYLVVTDRASAALSAAAAAILIAGGIGRVFGR